MMTKLLFLLINVVFSYFNSVFACVSLYDRSASMPKMESMVLKKLVEEYDGDGCQCLGKLSYKQEQLDHNKKSQLIDRFKTECINFNVDYVNSTAYTNNDVKGVLESIAKSRFENLLSNYVDNVVGRELVYRILAKFLLNIYVDRIFTQLLSYFSTLNSTNASCGVTYCDYMPLFVAYDVLNVDSNEDLISRLNKDSKLIEEELINAILDKHWEEIIRGHDISFIQVSDVQLGTIAAKPTTFQDRVNDKFKMLLSDINTISESLRHEKLEIKIVEGKDNYNREYIWNRIEISCLPSLCSATSSSKVIHDDRWVETEYILQTPESIFHHELCHYFRIGLERISPKTNDYENIKLIIDCLGKRNDKDDQNKSNKEYQEFLKARCSEFISVFTDSEEFANITGILPYNGKLCLDRMNESEFHKCSKYQHGCWLRCSHISYYPLARYSLIKDALYFVG